jgi:capsular exopolysaccharide synthesis family protein
MLLSGRAELRDSVHFLEGPRFFLIPAGPVPPNPAELVTSSTMRWVLDALRGQYDVVIIDTPPVLPTTDTLVLARYADGVVFVVKGRDTPRDLVRRARDQLARAGGRLFGVVVNNVGLSWDSLHLLYEERYAYRHVDEEETA